MQTRSLPPVKSLCLALVLGVSTQAGISLAAPFNVSLNPLSTYNSGGSEIVAYDKVTQRMFISDATHNQLHVVNIADPAAPALVQSLDMSAYGTTINSVDARVGRVAVAVEKRVDLNADTLADDNDLGTVVLFNASTLRKLHEYQVGYQPDMLTFTPDGKRILVANEGEPNQPYSYDPVGSVSVIDLQEGTVTNIGFEDFNTGGPRAGEVSPKIRIYGPGSSFAQDVEPEYIAVSPDSRRAWVTLQENNSLAEIDLVNLRINNISPFGLKPYNTTDNAMDLSDKDGFVGNFLRWRYTMGMYMPDGIAAYNINGLTYLITANEGDARAYDGFAEETRLKDVTQMSPELAANIADADLGRLTISSVDGLDGTGTLVSARSYGARSFSIWAPGGYLLQDSGNELDRMAVIAGNYDDGRSDNKGMEPESVITGNIDGRTFAFIGLERGPKSSIAIYDVTDPMNRRFVSYYAATNTDVSPEGLKFVPASTSPNGKDLLLVANEVSGTTTVYEVKKQ